MNEKRIVITEQSDGSLLFETKGFTGSACELEAKELADLLGETTSVSYKPEYHRRSFAEQGSAIATQKQSMET
jgi:Protein of unknown function (DUF2997)